jgi:hypothetical protein
MITLYSRAPVVGFSSVYCMAIVALAAPFARVMVVSPVWKHCRKIHRSVWSSDSHPTMRRTSVPKSGGSIDTMPDPATIAEVGAFIARIMLDAVISANANDTEAVRPVAGLDRGSSSSATVTCSVAMV